MPGTRISDVIVPEQLSEMVQAQVVPYMDFVALGIAARDYNNVDIRDGGNFAEIPFYVDFDDDDQVLEDDTSLVPSKITTGKDIGVVCHRGGAWANRDLATILSGDDPMKEIARLVSKWWGKKCNIHMISVLRGVFDASAGVLKDTHRTQVGVTSSTKVTIANSNVIEAAIGALGDAVGDLACIVVHSKVWGDMLKEKLVVFPERHDTDTVSMVPSSLQVGKENGRTGGKYMGLDVVVSDRVYVNTGTPSYPLYSCYIMKKGSMYYGMQRDIMTERDRDILAQKDVLSTTMHFVPHLKLVKWGVTTLNPGNTDLQTATNWTVVAADNKFIGAVELVVN